MTSPTQTQYDGPTWYGATTMLAALLSGPVYLKGHTGPAMDGSMYPSDFTTRVEATYGTPDSNGVYDLTAPVPIGPYLDIESVWGFSLWTASVAGYCFWIRMLEQTKNVYINDVGELASLPLAVSIVGQ